MRTLNDVWSRFALWRQTGTNAIRKTWAKLMLYGRCVIFVFEFAMIHLLSKVLRATLDAFEAKYGLQVRLIELEQDGRLDHRHDWEDEW
jgi:hypothetical protein